MMRILQAESYVCPPERLQLLDRVRHRVEVLERIEEAAKVLLHELGEQVVAVLEVQVDRRWRVTDPFRQAPHREVGVALDEKLLGCFENDLSEVRRRSGG